MSHNIYFCEPLSQDTYLFGGVKFKVTDNFYKILQNPPKKYISNTTNAYVFGKKYNKKEYKYLGYHGNDIAQTGLINLDIFKKKTTKTDLHNLDTNTFYPDYNWNNRIHLKNLQKIYPYVLFVGETVGGDVGASLYVHYNKSGDIDSLIIDNLHIFQS